MCLRKNSPLTLAFVSLLSGLPLLANDTCNLKPLLHQHRDVATVQYLEEQWSRAYLRGDTDFERCLLVPDFTEILSTGTVKGLSDELGFAAKNKGKHLPIPNLPETDVLLHGNVAVAYGTSSSTGPDGRTRIKRFADSYLWENGAWHVVFAQQTPVE